MVFKKRSYSNHHLILPLVTDYAEKKQMSTKTMVQIGPLHQRYEDDRDTSFWRRWSSGQLSQTSDNSKKDDDIPTLPQWGNPQEDDQYDASAQPKNQIIFTTRRQKPVVWSLLALCLPVIGGMTFWHLKSSLRLILEESDKVLAVRSQLNIKLRSAEKDVRMLARELAATTRLFEKQITKIHQVRKHSSEDVRRVHEGAKTSLTTMKNQVGSFTEQRILLKAAVKVQSRRHVEDKYGQDKIIQVVIELEFPDGREGPRSITVEMASLDLMPNSVYTFLEMISLGLWDGCSFVMKALHVLKAAPLPYGRSMDPAAAAKIFVTKNLNGPIFKEYNNAFPHELYTLGFAGGDSPSFYINTEDNTDLHAGDAAFAKIVSGFDTLKRVEDAPKENGIWLRDRIGIKSTKIVVL